MDRLLIDLSSVCWTSLFAGKDAEFGKTVEHKGRNVLVNSASHGYENAVNMILAASREAGVPPVGWLIVEESGNSKGFRRRIYEGYKNTENDKPEEAYAQFNLLKPMLKDALKAVGASVVTQPHIEADDIIAYLVQELPGNLTIVSNDGDLSVLTGVTIQKAPAVGRSEFLAPVQRTVRMWKGGEMLEGNPFGPFELRHVRLYKALVGDTSDTYPGAKGFGDKAFLSLNLTFGDDGLDAFIALLNKEEEDFNRLGRVTGVHLATLAEDVAEFKLLQKVLDNADTVVRCWMLARLYPERVNTLRTPLVWDAGMTKQGHRDERLRPFSGTTTLVMSQNYQQVMARLPAMFRASPRVFLDIEASTPPESDEWIEAAKEDAESAKDLGIDVLGAKLTGFSLTFGDNSQHTVYVSVDHADSPNITSEQGRLMVALIESNKELVVHNSSYELTVLFREWAAAQSDNGWHGFLPNVRDTRIMANYVDENNSAALKSLSKRLFGYDQVTYEEVTTKEGPVGSLPPGGVHVEDTSIYEMETYLKKVRGKDEREPAIRQKKDGNGNPILIERREKRQYKMRELTAREVLSYGADDTICTAAVYYYCRLIMDLEHTTDLMEEIEVLPAYVTAHAFVNGTKFSTQRMRELADADATVFDEAWVTVRDYLIKIGYEGTVCPVLTDLGDYKQVKQAYYLITGQELDTQMRTASKVIRLIEEDEHEDAPLLASLLARGDLAQINDWIRSRFTGEPVMDLNSPKKMQKLLYDCMGLPVKLVNSCTPDERRNNPALAAAIGSFRKMASGSQQEAMKRYKGPLDDEAAVAAHLRLAIDSPWSLLTDAERALVKSKGRTDDVVVDFAIKETDNQELKDALEKLALMKKVDTRRKLFYRPYRHVRHWSDGLVHAQANQCAAVTRRYSYKQPNLQQLPKEGESVQFRSCYVPHHKDAVIVSIDAPAQEIRLQAGYSRDPNLLSCYVGDNLRDFHSITASGAMRLVWSQEEYEKCMGALGDVLPPSEYETFRSLLKSHDKEVAQLAKDLRRDSKPVNFGSSYGCTPPKIQELLLCDLPTATSFLEAKYAQFPRYEAWKEEVGEEARRLGYVATAMGGRRHLRESVLSENRWEVEGAMRQASNFMIQSGGAEMLKRAMGEVWKSGLLFRLDCRFFAIVHDELVFSVHRRDALELIRIVHGAMSLPYTPTFPVPFGGSISLGPNFADQVELGETVDPARITRALELLFDGTGRTVKEISNVLDDELVAA